ncbi:MAG: hypothetical protein ACUVX8_03360 [Candidatus Zipacnadales bacterium]
MVRYCNIGRIWTGIAILALGAASLAAQDYYDLILANRVIGRLRDPGPYGSVSARGSYVEKNIVEALSVEDVGKPKMWIKIEGGLPYIYIGRTYLVEVRPGDVTGKGISKLALARQWVAGFKQQFPGAQPLTKMGRGATDEGRSVAAPLVSTKRAITVPEEDQALVEEVTKLLTASRNLAADDFEARSAELAAEIVMLVLRASGRDMSSSNLEELAGGTQALRSALNGLRFARTASDDTFAEQTTLIAVTVVQRVRAAMPELAVEGRGSEA